MRARGRRPLPGLRPLPVLSSRRLCDWACTQGVLNGELSAERLLQGVIFAQKVEASVRFALGAARVAPTNNEDEPGSGTMASIKSAHSVGFE